MTKKRRTTFLIILSGVFALAFLLATLTYNSSAKVYADETGIILERKTSDGNFSFKGPHIEYPDGETNINAGKLVIPLSLDNAAIDGYNGNGLSTGYSQSLLDYVQVIKCPNTEARLSLTIYKGTEESKDNVAIIRYDIVSFMDYTKVYSKKLSNTSNIAVSFGGFSQLNNLNDSTRQYLDSNVLNGVPLYDEMKYAKGPFKYDVGDYDVLYKHGGKFGLSWEKRDDGAYMDITLSNVAVKESYYVDLTYCFFIGCGSGINYGKRTSEYIGNIKSEYANVVGILNEEQESGALNSKSSSYKDYAQKILDGYALKDVRVRYLVDLKDTPFAVMTEKKIKIPVYNYGVLVSDVTTALNLDTLILKYASVDSFVYDKDASDKTHDEVYVAQYRDGIQLSAKTTDSGRNNNYYLDINKSYREYFGKLITDGVITKGLYKWFYNDILTRQYPGIKELELLPGQEGDLYGYFGFIMIPQTNSIEAVWGDLFNKDTTYSGTIHYTMNTTVLTISAYDKLLGEYKYSWLQRAWNNVTGLVQNYNANIYIFYVDSAENGDLWVGENGAADKDDNKGSLWGDISDGATQVGDIVSNLWNNTFGALSKLSGGIAGTIIIIAVVAGIILFIKYKKGGNRRR